MASQVRMSPAKPKKASSKSSKVAGKRGKPAAAGKASKAAKGRKTAKASSKAAKRGGATRAVAPKQATGHAHCAATDPFGGSCQNLPRRPSKYCVIHSYLDR